MSSGQRRVIYNSRERVISDDQNLAQAFIASDRAQTLRRLYNRATTNRDPFLYPGLSPQNVALPVATRGTVHDVYGGLLVRPDLGTSLTIDSGVVGMLVPDYPDLGANDSPYIVVDSPGLGSGVLTFTPNASGSPRIDVIECRVISELVSSQVRDIIAPDGTITPQMVEKVRRAALEFRVRVGVPNANWPAVEQNWLPLAVAVVQSGATDFSQADFYDVRPLVSERLGTSSSIMPVVGLPGGVIPGDYGWSIAKITSRSITSNTAAYALGESHGYRIGGSLIWKNTPSSLASFGTTGNGAFSPSSAENALAQAPSIADGDLNAMVFAFPMGLPRWVRYTQLPVSNALGEQKPQANIAMNGRLPRGPNGILLIGRPTIMTASGQTNITGYPAVFGLGTQTGQSDLGVIAGWTVGDGTNHLMVFSEGKRHRLPTIDTNGTPRWTMGGTVTGGVGTAAGSVTQSLNSTSPAIGLAASPLSFPMSAGRVSVWSRWAATFSGVTGRYNISPARVLVSTAILSSFGQVYSFPADGASTGKEFCDDLQLATPPGDPTDFNVSNSQWQRSATIENAAGNTFATFGVVLGLLGWEDSL